MKSDDQPGESPEGELARVRAKRLLRTDKPNYLDNEDFEEEVYHMHSSKAALHGAQISSIKHSCTCLLAQVLL